MPKNKNKQLLRVIILTVVGSVAFVVSVFMNVVGMRDAINKEPDVSGMAAFSTRTLEDKSVSTNSTKVDDVGKVVEEDILVNALPIINLNNNKWDRLEAKFSNFTLDENGNAVFDKEGYTLFCNGTYVNYAVFNKNFEKDVIGHVKVGENFDSIETKLGEPTFKRDEYIAYKTREVYVFFYSDEIVVYPNRRISNKKLEELFRDYTERRYFDGRTRFLVEIRERFPDIIITQDEEKDIIYLKSLTRQFVAKLDELGNIEVELYIGYKIATDSVQEYVDKNVYTTNEEDLVEIAENERVSGN